MPKKIAGHAELLGDAALRPWAVNAETDRELLAHENMLARTVLHTNPLSSKYGLSVLDDEQLPDLTPAKPEFSTQAFNVNQMARHFSQQAVIERLEASGIFDEARLHPDPATTAKQEEREPGFLEGEGPAPEDPAGEGLILEDEGEGLGEWDSQDQQLNPGLEGEDGLTSAQGPGPETVDGAEVTENGEDGPSMGTIVAAWNAIKILDPDHGESVSDGSEDHAARAKPPPSPVKCKPPRPGQIPSVQYTRPHSAYSRLRGLPDTARPSSASSRRPGSATAKSRAWAATNRPVSANAATRAATGRPPLPLPLNPTAPSKNQRLLAEAQASVEYAARLPLRARPTTTACLSHGGGGDDSTADAATTGSLEEGCSLTPSERAATVGNVVADAAARPATPSERQVNLGSLGLGRARVTGTRSQLKRSYEQRRRDMRYTAQGPWDRERTAARRKRRDHDIKAPRPQVDAGALFQQQRAAIKESKRINTIDHTWNLMNFPMTSQQQARNSISEQHARYPHDEFYEAESKRGRELNPQNYLPHDGIKKWANEAARMGWDMYKS